MGKTVDISVWTLERFLELEQGAMNEPVEIDLQEYESAGIPCIKADLGDVSSYEAYLAIIPGKLLADFFLKFGSRILEGNVRSYLGSNKVNKGILSTIRSAPCFFFTYNNGIAATAADIVVRRTEHGLLIRKIKNFQIINGGQTTASLATALVKNTDLSGVFVPMKLTIVRPEENETNGAEQPAEPDPFTEAPKTFEDRYQEMVSNISRYANTQTKVNDADFFSNHEFHRRMERLSAGNIAPAKPGAVAGTVWFYERARGQYNQAQFNLSESERKRFLQKHPKSQKITKEKFAKCITAYMLQPYIVAKGSAACVKALSKYILKEWETADGKAKINNFYFKTSVVAVIIFDSTDRVINARSWYAKGGCKAELVPYTIAKILSMIPRGKWIDIQKIWDKQQIPDSFVNAIDRIGKSVYAYLQEKSGGALVRTVAQKEETWTELKAKQLDVDLPDSFMEDLVAADSMRNTAKEEKNIEKIMDEVTDQMKVINLGVEYWVKLFDEAAELKLIDPDRALELNGLVGKINNGSISERDARRLLKVQKDLLEIGVVVKQ
jgi:hypothetical protein